MQDHSAMSPVKAKTNLRALAYRSFMQNLLARKIRPGQFLSQRELVAITGVPLAAVRELIPRLEAEKLIETVPQRGLRVAGVDLKLIREVHQLWSLITRAAAASFIETASDDLLAELERAHQAMLLRIGRPADDALAADARELELAFHRHLVGALDNDIIADLTRVNRIKLDMIGLTRAAADGSGSAAAIEERLQIIQALKRRDVALALRAVDRHLDGALQRAVLSPCAVPARRPSLAGTEGGIAA
jgi:DNA-binding GntR family transcriptional regulator